jgi:hypothetical protein
MAGIYIPITTTYVNNVVEVVSTTRTTYEQIINSMGSYVYGIDSLYIKTNSSSQLLETLKFLQYDSNGTLKAFSQVTPVSPYQYQNSAIFELTKENVVLNGRVSMSTKILPNEEIFLNLYVDELKNSDALPKNDFLDDSFFTDFLNEI